MEGSTERCTTVLLDHDSLRKVLEDAGFRCTPQRLAVYDH